MRELLLRKCVFELTTPQCHRGIFQQFWSTDQKINFSTTVSILESPTVKRVLFRGMGIFSSQNNLRASLVGKESHIWSISECRVKSEMANYVNFARRMRLPSLHFQLDDHIPTMASYQTSIISPGVQPPPMAVSRTTSSLKLRLAIVWGKSTSQWGQWGY